MSDPRPDPSPTEPRQAHRAPDRRPVAPGRVPGARLGGRPARSSRPPEVLFASALISEMSGNLKAVRDRMVERGLDRDYDLVTMLRPRAGEPRGLTGRLRLARALARAEVILLDDSYPPLHWIRLRPKVRIIQLWHAAGAFKTVGYSRRRHARRRGPVRAGPQGLHRRDRQLRPRHPVLCRGVRHPGGARHPDGHPADGPLLRRARAGPPASRPRARLSRERGQVHHPVRPDVPRPTVRRARRSISTGSTMPPSTRSPSRRTRWSSSGCIRSIREPLDIPEPLRDRLLDGSKPRSTSTTCCSRSTCSSPTTRRSCSSSRPSAGRCSSSPTTSTSTSASATSTPVRGVRAGPDRPDLPGAASTRSGATTTRSKRSPTSPPAISPTSTRLDPTGSSTSSSSAR